MGGVVVMGKEEKEKTASVDEVLKMLMGSGASEIVVERVYTKKKTGKGIKISSLGSMGSEGSDEEKKSIKEVLQVEQAYKEHIDKLETENKELKKENSELKHYCEKEMPLIFLSIRQNIDELKKYNENLTHSLEEVKTRSTDDLKKCVALNKEIETLKRKLDELEEKQRRNRTGKRTELNNTEIEKIIGGYCLGFSYNQIASYSGCSRMQVSRVIKGEFKHTQSKEKIVRVLNKLLKINQNPQRVEKLKELKEKYL